MVQQNVIDPGSDWSHPFLMNTLFVLSYDTVVDENNEIRILPEPLITPDGQRLGVRLSFWNCVGSYQNILSYLRHYPDALPLPQAWGVRIAWLYAYIANQPELCQILIDPQGSTEDLCFTNESALRYLRESHARMRQLEAGIKKAGMIKDIPLVSDNDEFVRRNRLMGIGSADRHVTKAEVPIDCPHCGLTFQLDEVIYLGLRDGELPYVSCVGCHRRFLDAPFCSIVCQKCGRQSGLMPPGLVQPLLADQNWECSGCLLQNASVSHVVDQIAKKGEAKSPPQTETHGSGCLVLLAMLGSFLSATIGLISFSFS